MPDFITAGKDGLRFVRHLSKMRVEGQMVDFGEVSDSASDSSLETSGAQEDLDFQLEDHLEEPPLKKPRYGPRSTNPIVRPCP